MITFFPSQNSFRISILTQKKKQNKNGQSQTVQAKKWVKAKPLKQKKMGQSQTTTAGTNAESIKGYQTFDVDPFRAIFREREKEELKKRQLEELKETDALRGYVYEKCLKNPTESFVSSSYRTTCSIKSYNPDRIRVIAKELNLKGLNTETWNSTKTFKIWPTKYQGEHGEHNPLS